MNAKPFTVALGVLLICGLLAVAAGPAAAAGPTDESTAGPPDNLPDPVPEFVSDILSAISEFLSTATEIGNNASTEMTSLTPLHR